MNYLNSWKNIINVEEYLKTQSNLKDPFKREIDNPIFISSLGEIKSKKVVEAGCGDGMLCKILDEMGADVVGIDGSKIILEKAREAFPRGKFVEVDLETEGWPVEDNSTDIVFTKYLLMYLDSFKMFVNESLRVLKPGGILSLCVIHPKRSTTNRKKYDFKKKNNKKTAGKVKHGSAKFPLIFRTEEEYLSELERNNLKLIKRREIIADKEFVKKYPKESAKLNLPISLHLTFQKTLT